MKAPKIHDSLSWGKRRGQNTSTGGMTRETTGAVTPRDRYHKVDNRQDAKPENVSKPVRPEIVQDEQTAYVEFGKVSAISISQKHTMSANQLAAKALQLRMKGKHEEAEELQVSNAYSFLRLFLSTKKVCYLIMPDCMSLSRHLKKQLLAALQTILVFCYGQCI